MMWFHSTLHVYGFEVEQIPLPPRHAHNASDRCVDLYCRAQLRPRMIARLNRFFRRMMRTHHILGAKQFYDTISMASPSSFSGQRLVNRCHVLYRHFKVADFIAPTAPSLNQEAKLGEATGGIMSVGRIMHVLGDPGVVVVREFGDTSMAVDKNPPVLFDLLKREIATCQTCSNREVSTSSLRTLL